MNSLEGLENSIQSTDDFDFYSACKERGLSIFYGMLIHEGAEVAIIGAEHFLDFCSVNGIKSIILDTEYEDTDNTELQIEFEICKEKLAKFFEKKVSGFPYSLLPEHISKDFYTVVLDDVLHEMEKEIQCINSNRMESFREDIDKEEKLLSIEAYALFEGTIVSTILYSIDDEETEEQDHPEEIVTEKSLLNKYAGIISKKLEIREVEAKKQSDQITKALKEKIFGEIEEEIRDHNKLSAMKTQKSRNEFADRLYVKWKEDKGNEYLWFTKTAVRALVEREYFHATEHV